MPYHYNPNQLRVPAGHHDGGQWTSEGGQPGERVQPVQTGNMGDTLDRIHG